MKTIVDVLVLQVIQEIIVRHKLHVQQVLMVMLVRMVDQQQDLY